jgi:hypothetical protein
MWNTLRSFAADYPLPSRLELNQAAILSQAFLPYPRQLTWPSNPFGVELGSLSFRNFPQFDGVANHNPGILERTNGLHRLATPSLGK